jgi:BirA family transcriptional regulator, biotin operon repressor / biotin---[acetyl-CoA-carboxylase] ligase
MTRTAISPRLAIRIFESTGENLNGVDPPSATTGASPAGWHVTHVAETGSTNTDLMAAAAADAPDRSVLVTSHQTAGKGRLDRTWDAPPGANLLVSVLFRSGFDPSNPHSLTQAVAVAAARTAEALGGRRPDLKWPNDLLLDGAKLGGILAQSSLTAGQMCVVVGMGLNLGWAPPEAARLAGVTPTEFLPAWLATLSETIGSDCFEEYRSRLTTIGQEVRVELPGETIHGTATEIRRDGSLIVEANGGLRTVSVGDVVHLRSPSADGSN